MKNKLSLFENNEIRKIYKNNKWYYSVIDVISFFTCSSNPTQYLNKLKTKDIFLQKEWDNICIYINMQTKDGKIRKVMSADTIGVLRIIESINEEKAEPIKRWLARLGYERIEEISNPELIMDRMKKLYEIKGYSKGWIEQREREITTRHSLKDEWEKRGIKQSEDYLFLTNEIYKTTFNKDLEEYKNIKGINDSNYLKDSMTNLELALINLSEASIAQLHLKNSSSNLEELTKDINSIGKIINRTKKDLEEELKTSITNNENNINLTNHY
jgi:hypothetical protein